MRSRRTDDHVAEEGNRSGAGSQASPNPSGAPAVHLSFRFHVNLYHSYRGDSLDEHGIGKDIRVIRGILDALDALEAGGIALRCAWDIENCYSLELYLPRHAPDIIERIKERVASGKDEIELMSWNNGLLTAHSPDELDLALGWAVSNSRGSGVEQVFGSWARIARPQENMFSAWQIPAYRRAGVEAVSLYYSAAPFNGFSSFVPLLPPIERYNPLSMRDEVSVETIRVLPAVNHADLVEHFASLRSLLGSMRRAQLSMEEPADLILVVDMDADDSFWSGYLPGSLRSFFPSFCGLESLAKSLAGIPWLRFALPGEYLETHPDRGEISLGQDLADGSFDGYSSWAEKAENAELWTILAEARRKRLLAARILAELMIAERSGEIDAGYTLDMGAPDPHAWEAALADAEKAMLEALSTTHFGMASPVMHAGRLRDALRHSQEALGAAEKLLRLAEPDPTVFFFDSGIDAMERGSGALVALPEGVEGEPGAFSRLELGGETVRLMAVNPARSRERVLSWPASGGDRSLELGPDWIRTDRFELKAAEGAGLILLDRGRAVFEAPLSTPWVRYGGCILEGSAHCLLQRLGNPPERRIATRGLVPSRLAELRIEGRIELDGGAAVLWAHVYTIAAGLSSIRADILVDYPETEPRGYDRRKAERLERSWDARWKEVAPFELVPDLGASAEAPARVWRRAFDGSVRSYTLEYHRFGPNRDLDSLDNHCADGWVAVSGPERGLLVAQAESAMSLFAFCPMRVGFSGHRQSVRLNPFGSYYGRQWRNPPAFTGLGRLAAVAVGDNYDPYAPSWAGKRLRASLMLAPFDGSSPPEGLQRDALVFAKPPIVPGRRAIG
ncbi:MAG TPA: hypothetical protein VIO60_11610 [Rectinemataceae bacterium]